MAYNTYQAVYSNHKLRKSVMRTVTTGFASLTFYATFRLFMQDRKDSLTKIGGNVFGLYLLAKMFIQLLPEYLAYYKDDFNPAEIDYSREVEYWKNKLANDYQMAGFA